MGGNQRTELGEFLRSRRAALSPEDAGIPASWTERRVPGLRREEVADLAGLSVSYYTRLEQGENHQMSGSLVDAIAGALRLDEGERLHLRRLAWPVQVARPRTDPEEVRGSLLTLAGSHTGAAVFVLGRRMDLLYGNALAYALFGQPHGRRINLALRAFLDPGVRDLYVHWESYAREIAAYLRVAGSDGPEDPELAGLIGELRIKSPDFVRIWSAHPVAECAHSTREYNHPVVGRMTLDDESLRVPDPAGQRISFLTATPGSESAERLRRLASLAAQKVDRS